MKQFAFPRFCYTSNRRGERKKWTSFHTILVLSFVKHSFILKRKVLMRNNLLISKHFLTMSIERGACSKNHWKKLCKDLNFGKIFFLSEKKARNRIHKRNTFVSGTYYNNIRQWCGERRAWRKGDCFSKICEKIFVDSKISMYRVYKVIKVNTIDQFIDLFQSVIWWWWWFLYHRKIDS